MAMSVRDPKLDTITAMRRDKASIIETGPREWSSGIPENATPFMLPQIWDLQIQAFYNMNGITVCENCERPFDLHIEGEDTYGRETYRCPV